MADISSAFSKFVSEFDETPVAGDFTKMTFKNLRSKQVLEFFEKEKRIDNAPDKMSFGGETEINIEYYSKPDVTTIQVGRNLNAEIPLTGKLLGKNAVYNANVLEAWRLSRDQIEFVWFGMTYVVMIGKTSFDVDETFEVSYNVTLKVIKNKTFDSKALPAAPKKDLGKHMDDLAVFGAKIDVSMTVLELLKVKKVNNPDNLAKSFLDQINSVINLGRQLVSNITKLGDIIRSALDTAKRIIDFPRQMIRSIQAAAKLVTDNINDFVGFIEGTAEHLGIKKSTAQSKADVLAAAKRSTGSSVSPASATMLDITARRAARAAKIASGKVIQIHLVVRSKTVRYKVKRKDSLRSIATASGCTIDTIKYANPKLTVEQMETPGTIINIPVVDGD